MIRAAFLASALLLVPGLVTPGLADEDLAGSGGRCGASRDGMVACMAGRACLCRYERGGQMTGRPAGFRWDCGALRPDCAPGPMGEPTARDVPGGSLPWAEPRGAEPSGAR